MKTHLLTAAAVIAGAATIGFAQPAPGGAQNTGPRPAMRSAGPDAATVQRELGLSDEQAAQLRKMRTDARIQAIRHRADLQIARIELEQALEAPTVDEKLVSAKVKAVADLQAAAVRSRADERLAMRKLLSPEQQQKMRQLMRERRPGRGPGPAGRPAGRQPRPGFGPQGPQAGPPKGLGPGGPGPDDLDQEPTEPIR